MGRTSLQAGALARSVKTEGRDATVDGMYLRIVIHANEHMGQLIARVNGPADMLPVIWPIVASWEMTPLKRRPGNSTDR